MHAIVFLASCLAIADAVAHRAHMSLVDSVKSSSLAAQGWTVQRIPEANETIALQIGLNFQGEEALINKLKDISDPSSKNYGRWLSREEANKIAQPSLDNLEKVKRWLIESGIEKFEWDSNGMWVSFRAAVGKANEMFGAEFVEFGHRDGGGRKVRTLGYSVPSALVGVVDLVHPTTFFGRTGAQKFKEEPLVEDKKGRKAVGERFEEYGVRPLCEKGRCRSSSADEEPVNDNVMLPQLTEREIGLHDTPTSKQTTHLDYGCQKNITPRCLKQIYNLTSYKPSPNSGSRIGFGSFLNQTSTFTDTEAFKYAFHIEGDLKKVNINNASDDQGPTNEHGEANLDAQCQLGIAGPLPITEFLTGVSPPVIPDLDVNHGGENSNEPYVPYYQYLLSQSNEELPQAISNSYGEPEHTVPLNYAKRTCLMIAMLGLRGVTVFHSSGDTGIGSGCLSNDRKRKLEFTSMFPASCPWVTAVGGMESLAPEIAWRDSSGGFSTYFGRPWYQKDAVKTFLEEVLPKSVKEYFKSYFRADGRAFPDISAHSLYPAYTIFHNGHLIRTGGTSAAAPVWAALTGLLNDARLKTGKPTMGFINPWLYAHGKDFLLDTTKGGSRGCDGTNHQTGKTLNGAGVIPWASWNATEGWDPVTGLGVPDFGRMVESAMRIV